MWYAVQVMTGREETVRDMCKRLIDRKQYNDIFVIRFDKAKRYYGTWHKEIMFPGYIFIDSDNPQQIYEHLKSVPELTKMLGRDKNEFTPIEAGKEAMFKAMVNDNYEISLSVGIIEGDKVIVKEGPLSGMEVLIKKIDRHKRVAVLNAQMFEQDVDIKIGLEIIEKYKK